MRKHKSTKGAAHARSPMYTLRRKSVSGSVPVCVVCALVCLVRATQARSSRNKEFCSIIRRARRGTGAELRDRRIAPLL